MSGDMKKEALLPARAVQTFPPMTPQERTTALLLVLLYPEEAGKSTRPPAAQAPAACLAGSGPASTLGAARSLRPMPFFRPWERTGKKRFARPIAPEAIFRHPFGSSPKPTTRGSTARRRALWSGGVISNTQAAYYAGQADAAQSLKREKAAARFAQTAGSESGLVYDDFVKEAVESGRTLADVNGETRAYLTADSASKINRVAKALGVRVRFVDSISVNGQEDAANAAISGAEVRLQKDNPNPVRFLMGHEMTHRMQELAPKEYRAFRAAAANDLVVQRAVQDQIDRHARRGLSITYEAALDEAAADYAGRLVQDGAVLEDFIRQHKENRSLLEKLRDAVRGLVRKLTGAEKKQAQTAEDRLTAALEAAARRAEKLNAEKTPPRRAARKDLLLTSSSAMNCGNGSRMDSPTASSSSWAVRALCCKVSALLKAIFIWMGTRSAPS